MIFTLSAKLAVSAGPKQDDLKG